MQFRIIHLLLFVTGFAAVFAFASWSFPAACIAYVFTFGVGIAHSTSPRVASCVAGCIVSTISVAISTVLLASIFIEYEIVQGRVLVFRQSSYLLFVPIFSSFVGGYIGAKTTNQ